MMCFTSTTYAYAAASNPSSCRAPSRLIFAACGFGGFSWGDRCRAFLGDGFFLATPAPPVESCISSSVGGAPTAPAPAAPSCAGAGGAVDLRFIAKVTACSVPF